MRQQLKYAQGFTMIELIMVIVILGVLSAFALPKFADLGGSARGAAIQGFSGAIRSAIGITRAAALAKGAGAASSVALDSATTVALVNGYPAASTAALVDVSGIVLAAGLDVNGGTDIASYDDESGDYTYSYVAANIISIFHKTAGTVATDAAGTGLTCGIVYSIATAPPSVVTEVDGC